jgi:hypothetical protein
MAKIAMDEKAELSLLAQMYKELAQYVAPKRKSVEVQAEVGYSWIDAIRDRYKYEHNPEWLAEISNRSSTTQDS